MDWGTTTQPTVIPDLDFSQAVGDRRIEAHTCDQVPGQPLEIIATDPVSKREEIVGPMKDSLSCGSDFPDPFHRGWLLFNIRIGR